MVTAMCIQKLRGKNNVITGYILEDINGNKARVAVAPEELKQAIIKNSIQIVNLKLTSDGRLIDCETNTKKIINTPNTVKSTTMEDKTYTVKSKTMADMITKRFINGAMADRVLKALKQMENVVKSDFTTFDINQPKPQKAVRKMFDICLNMGLSHGGIDDWALSCKNAFEKLDTLEEYEQCRQEHEERELCIISFDLGIDLDGDSDRLEIIFYSYGFKNLSSFRSEILDYVFPEDFDYHFKEERDFNHLGELQDIIEIVESVIPPEKFIMQI